MNSIYKTTTWIVIIVSICLIFLYLFAIFAVASSGHNTLSTLEICSLLLYLTCLPVSLYNWLSQNSKNHFIKIISILLVLIGIVFCIKGLYENSLEGFGTTEYFVVGIPLTLLLITSIGLLKKRL